MRGTVEIAGQLMGVPAYCRWTILITVVQSSWLFVSPRCKFVETFKNNAVMFVRE